MPKFVTIRVRAGTRTYATGTWDTRDVDNKSLAIWRRQYLNADSEQFRLEISPRFDSRDEAAAFQFEPSPGE